jgi:hypothetical protein
MHALRGESVTLLGIRDSLRASLGRGTLTKTKMHALRAMHFLSATLSQVNLARAADKKCTLTGAFWFCREEGIRTLDALLEHTHFPGVRLRPLGHLSLRMQMTKKNLGWENFKEVLNRKV